MNKPLKITAMIVVAILVLVVALIVVAKLVITPERVKATVLPLAEENLSRKVDFTGLDISLFSGITLEGFSIAEEDGSGTFVSLEGLVLDYQLLPLLAGRVVVDEVRLVRPRIQVVRSRDGAFNFDTIGPREKATGGAAESPAPAEEQSSGEAKGIDLLVAEINIQGGSLLYRDHTLTTGAPFETSLDDMTLAVRDFSLNKAFPFEFSGRFAEAVLNAAGQFDLAKTEGSFDLDFEGMKLGHLKALAADAYPGHLEPLTLAMSLHAQGGPNQAAVKGLARLGLLDQQVTVDFEVGDLLATPIPASFAIAAKKLQIDALMGPEKETRAAAAPGGGSGDGNGDSRAEEPGPIDVPLEAKGNIMVDVLRYHEFEMTQAVVDWSLRQNILDVSRVHALTAEGEVSGQARVNLAQKGLDYRTGWSLKGIQADPLVSAFYPKYRGTVFGGLDLDIKLAGQGTRTKTLKRNLNGNGVVHLKEGKIIGAPLLDGLAVFLGSEELKVLSFSTGTADFRIENGKVNVASTFTGSKARMTPNGQVGLDGSLDLRLETRLSPELTDKVAGKSEFAGALKDEQGWGLFPLRVKGSMDKPRFTLDSKAARKQLKEQVKKKAVEELSKELFKDEASKDAGEKVLKDTLKGLLGN